MSYLGQEIGKLGFGLMRLPRLEDGQIDVPQVCQMVDAFLEAGFTYFDTAWIYGGSEDAIRQALVERHPRESYQLATKGISWICKTPEEAQAQFTTSLERTGAGYFDFYLLHMTGSGRQAAFEALGMWDFCLKQKEAGLIRHLGFSHHGKADELDQILTAHPEAEFVQLQVNYLDWESPLHESRKALEVCAKHNVPVVVMEPIRGGLLADPPKTVADVLAAADPDVSPAGWALRFVASQPNMITVLSGMSTLEQMQDNIRSMKGFEKLDEAGMQAIADAQAEFAKFDLVPCTACNYCAGACPENVGISGALLALNANRMFGRHVQEWIVGGSGKQKPSSCVECYACEAMCPQQLSIVDLLKEAAELIG
ncbi:MAG: aldo/keto reductase [Coriobacteriia bacterium]|nr:aldo/keto reductase [Coriobacteriia bacterium]